jgi:hypothetical protein
LKNTIILFACLLFSGLAYGQSTDECHVYLVDVEAAQKMLEKLEKSGTLTPEEMSKPTKILGTFAAKIGEEELTTKHFPIPNSKSIISASVFYTDESMALQKKGNELIEDSSITLGIVISNKKEENALSAENGAVAESTYNQHTLGVRVKTKVSIDKHKYLVGLECHCNGSHLPKEK